MDFLKFKELSKNHNIIPVYERITADMLTPVLAYLKIREKNKYCFLLESVEGIGRLARYSFIGKNPIKLFSNQGMEISITDKGNQYVIKKNFFDFLKEEMHNYNIPTIKELPDFTGGIVGYLGFENVSLIEEVIQFDGKNETANPDSIFGVFNTIIAFDHYKHQLILITNAVIDESSNLEEKYKNAKAELASLKELINKPIQHKSDFRLDKSENNEIDINHFSEIIGKAKKHIYEGDVFQLVYSKRFTSKYTGDLLNVYRALRIINPSPYMYFMEFNNDLTVIGTSPEDLIKVKESKATILPIAGTRRRGRTDKEDIEMENDLMSDPKEKAEHVMLVDLARNDLGRVCKYDTVKVSENMNVQRFSHVMHIVSRVEGVLRSDKDCIDALKASFPAGTVSGAPKIRAIQLINEYEQLVRNVYAGAVGYINFNGNLDMCIAIRTLFSHKDKIIWQAGAGIVADSNPELELKEIKNKSAVLLNALKYAEVIDENFSN
jgi:anthranilate synthase component 1